MKVLRCGRCFKARFAPELPEVAGAAFALRCLSCGRIHALLLSPASSDDASGGDEVERALEGNRVDE